MKTKTRWIISSTIASIAIVSAFAWQLSFGAEKEKFNPAFLNSLRATAIPSYVEAPEPSPPATIPGTLGHAKIAVIHWAPRKAAPIGVPQSEVDLFKQESALDLENLIREAATGGAKLVVTPEFSYVGYPDIPGVPDEDDEFRSKDEVRPFIDFQGSAMEQRWGKLAKDLGIYLIIGYPIQGPTYNEINNTVTLWKPDGAVMARYNKMHLYGDEYKFIDPGKSPMIVDTPFGRIGLLVCADIYGASGPVSYYMSNQVDLYVVSASWAVKGGVRYFASLANLVKKTVMVANHTYFPDAAIINGDGSAQSYIHSKAGVAYGYVPLVRPL